MSRPSLSIIIPTKNEGRYIGRTLAQFEPHWEQHNLEIIVSDANSADDTADVVRAYAERADGRVKLVQSVGKQNIAIGRNLGAAQAQADILLHTDADMRLPDPEKFFRQTLAAFDDPRTVAATVPLWVYPEESGWADRLYHILMNVTIRLSFFFGLYLAKGECQLVRRAAFSSVGGYNETLVAGEDCNLFYRLQKKGRIAYLHRLSVHHSPRRFREYGYLRLSLIYLREGLWMLFRHRSYSREWKPVR
jgi:glycosyltransferase involved in cell wall biosynthesis